MRDRSVFATQNCELIAFQKVLVNYYLEIERRKLSVITQKSIRKPSVDRYFLDTLLKSISTEFLTCVKYYANRLDRFRTL